MVEALGHYKILERVGAGGLGEVFRARDTRHGRTVAIKMVPAGVAGDAGRRAEFLRAAREIALLSHPNIASLYEIGDEPDRLYLVFDFVSGETLKAAIAGRPLNPRRAIDLAAQIADGLADAHAAGIVHGDVRTDNIVVTPKGNAKILDVGLAAWTNGGSQRRQAAALHAPEAAPGTADQTSGVAPYLSPEQALGEPVDDRTDIFSLGVVLFEMLTGKPPFAAATASGVVLQIVQAPAPQPSAINRSLPPEIDPVVAKALAKSLDHRYGSAAAMAADLRSVGALLDVRSEAAERDPASVVVRPPQRSYGTLIALLVVLAALAAAGWFFYGF